MGKRGRGSGLGTTLVLALVIVILSVALGVVLARYWEDVPLLSSFFGGERKTTTGPVVVEGIQRLDQLATVRWTEAVVVTKEDPGNLGEILTGEKIVLVATGEVEAGVDLTSLNPEDVQVDGERVTIRLPEPEILSSSLDEERTSVYDRDFGLLSLRPDDAIAEEARQEAQDEITVTAQENGILDQARSNAEESIEALALSLGFEEAEFNEA